MICRGAKVLMRCNTAAWAIMAHMVHAPNTPKAPLGWGPCSHEDARLYLPSPQCKVQPLHLLEYTITPSELKSPHISIRVMEFSTCYISFPVSAMPWTANHPRIKPPHTWIPVEVSTFRSSGQGGY
jgi:hypothetical protein